jgi:hypothetical protein
MKEAANRGGLYDHQKAFAGIALGALIGQQLKIPITRLDESQPHLVAAFQARHFNCGLKVRTGWRWAGYLHGILIFKERGRNATDNSHDLFTDSRIIEQ